MNILPKRIYLILALIIASIPLLAFGCNKKLYIYLAKTKTEADLETPRFVEATPGEEIENFVELDFDVGAYRYDGGHSGALAYRLTVSEGASLLSLEGDCFTELPENFSCYAPAAGDKNPITFDLNFSLKLDDTIPPDLTVIKVIGQSYSRNNGEIDSMDTFLIYVKQPLVHIIDNRTGKAIEDGSVTLDMGINTFTVQGANLEDQSVNLDELFLANIGQVRLFNGLSTTTLTSDQSATFSLFCERHQTITGKSNVVLGHDLSNIPSPLSFQAVCESDSQMQVVYEGADIDRGGQVQVSTGYHTFIIQHLATLALEPIQVSDPVLDGDANIILDSGVRSAQIFPDQETFFILNCTATEEGTYIALVSIGNSLGDPYFFTVVCEVSEEPDTEFSLDPSSGDSGSGGNDITNPEFIPSDPIDTPNTTTGTDTTSGTTTIDPLCPPGEC